MNVSIAADFRENTADSRRLVDYLSAASALERVHAGKARRARYLADRARTVVDIGCGPGDMLTLLAKDPNLSRIVGIDLNAELLDRAAQRLDDPRVETFLADAASLPFENCEFEAVLIERTLQHVQQPEWVIAEAVRVAAPGGTVLVVEPDWSTLGLDGAESVALTDAVLGAVGSLIRHPFVGRGLRGLLKRAGLESVVVDVEFHETSDLEIARLLALLDEGVAAVRTAGTVPAQALEEWYQDLAASAAKGEFSASLGLFVAVGRVPA